jgi:hypothetical protein
MKKLTSLLILFFCTICFYFSATAQNAANPLSVNVSGDSVTFVVIGDFGQNSKSEKAVAEMVKSWKFDFIITTGDNNYPLGSKKTIQKNIGKYYGDYIYNPDAPEKMKCNGKAFQDKVNRFFPCPGNHDNYSTPMLQPYLDYFTLPGDEKNYDFSWGPVRFFSLNTGRSADIACCDAPESVWLKEGLAKSKEPFKFVVFHHPPFSPGSHGSAEKMQWPFASWGTDAVLCGHEHFYARIMDKQTPKMPYITCGSSGNNRLYGCDEHPLDSSKFDVKCDENHWGAMLVRASRSKVVMEYYTTQDPTHPTDVYVIQK